MIIQTMQMAKIQYTYCCTVQHSLYLSSTPLCRSGENHSNSNSNNKMMLRTRTQHSIQHFESLA